MTIIIICTLLLTLIAGKLLIPWLTRMKYGQAIREDGPQSHQKKAGTPTMGGIIFIIPIIIFAFIAGLNKAYIAVIAFLAYGILGFLDDFIKISKKRNLGLTAKEKFLGQLIIGLGVGALSLHYFPEAGNIYLFNRGITIDVGLWLLPLSVLVLLSTSNAVNITDGLDGLATGVFMPAVLAIGFLSKISGNKDIWWLSLIIVAALLGFLYYNRHPARVFMGDTGSLALGGVIGAMAIVTGLEVILIPIAGVFVLETLSVIMQISYFRLTKGKRIFLMAPIHHHYELKGWKEKKVVTVFTLVSFILAIISVLFFI